MHTSTKSLFFLVLSCVIAAAQTVPCDWTACAFQICPPSVGDVGLCICSNNSTISSINACIQNACAAGSVTDETNQMNARVGCCNVWPTNQVNGVLGYLPLTASSQLASCTGVIWNALQTMTMTSTTSPTATGAGATVTAATTGGTTTKSSDAVTSINAGSIWGLMIGMLLGVVAIL